jgi:predicted AlkP superfamily phosphohydrolase/phosphomutase/tetratricopeptide (TPR) repeat protein
LVIGWDAADWQVIKPLIDAGHMPTLQKFLAEGVHGNIATLDPPYSPMLWTSIATGKYPHDHGVLGFIELLPDGSGIRPISSHSRKVKALWNIFNQEGIRSNVIGWWPSNPAEPIDGIMVSNLFQQARHRMDEPWPMVPGTINHPELEAQFAALRVHPHEITGSIMEPFIPKLKELDVEKDAALGTAVKIVAHAASIHAATTCVLEEHPADAVFVYHDAIDHMSHLAMKYRSPRLEGIAEFDFEHYKDLVDGMYRFHDMMLERLLSLVDEDTTVVLLSDHGFKNDHTRLVEVPIGPATPAIEHREYGILALRGPGIKKGQPIYGASLLDVAPTILHLMGLPVGEDMPGRVLIDAMEHPNVPTTIPSWESKPGNHGLLTNDQQGDADAEAFALKQLADLGYINKQEEAIEKKIQTCRRETALNHARSLIHAGLKHRAIQVLEAIEPEDANKYSHLLLLSQYVDAGDLSKALTQLTLCRERFPHSTNVQFQEAMLQWLTGKTHAATAGFDALIQKKPTAQLYFQIGKTYNIAGFYAAAEERLRAGLELEPNHVFLRHQLGFSLLRQGQAEAALEQFFQVIEGHFHFAKAHRFIGECFFHLGYYDQAAEALNLSLHMAPRDQETRALLVKIYAAHLHQPEQATALQAAVDNEPQPIVVVSGLPRSGTSLMMRMVESGGLPILKDAQRTPDSNNPHGYFELEAVKGLTYSAAFLDEAPGKAVKVVAPLLPYLPPKFRYKIIVMDRNISEVILSQQIMLGKTREQAIQNYPFRLAQTYYQQLERVNQWLEQRANVEVLRVQYADAHQFPLETAQRVADFLGLKGRVDAMVQAVDPTLYRNQHSNNSLI